jgi:hypothetical protein
MARRRSPILWLVAATAVVVMAWFVVTPRRAWRDFLRALAQGDNATLDSVVDFPAVRQQAAADLTIAFAEQSKSRPDMPENVREDLMKQMVNTVSSPQGLLQLVNTFSVASPTGQTARTAFQYHGISRVDVLLGGTGSADTGAGLFTFERTGTHWRLIRASSQRIAALTPRP